MFTGCTDFNTTAASLGVRVLSSTTGSTSTTGITINVTDTGWIKYTKSNGDTQYQQITSTGNYDIPDCAECLSVIPGYPYADLASFTISDCGNPC